MKPHGTLICDEDQFDARHLKLAHYADNPLENGSLDGYNVIRVPLTSLTLNAVEHTALGRRSRFRGMTERAAVAISNREIERRYPYRVDVVEPAGGLGSRLDVMRGWCRDNLPDWSDRRHTERGRIGDRFHYFVRFHFLTAEAADAFRRRWV